MGFDVRSNWSGETYWGGKEVSADLASQGWNDKCSAGSVQGEALKVKLLHGVNEPCGVVN
jgi:hypothetical protein